MTEYLDYWRCFAEDYASARHLFLEAATAAGAELTAYVHPDRKGPEGEALAVDVATLGPQDAHRQLLILSGTHGLEGRAGSAMQVAWLLAGDGGRLPPDVRVVLVHALNPYGFAYASRTTENNVDLNRNFVDHAAPYPDNPGYAELHKALLPPVWSEAALAATDAATARYRQEHGPDALFDVTARGQYTHPDGVMYGGRGREWSNLTLERIVRTHLAGARQIGLIDWHTGIGDYGEPFFLCFNPDGSDLQAEAARWWGQERVVGQRPNGLARPDYQGLVFNGVRQFLDGRPMVGAVIEYGTAAGPARAASRLDQWLRFVAPQQPDPRRDTILKADVIDAMVPTSSLWRRAVIKHGLEITRQAVAGIASWQTDATRAAALIGER
ncbi:M14 family metallopeptidase [Bordetella sp. N]|uniref:M14 family metallopeptidase n=1 Tax=Bordetella sp. N TaxID=1746199 RepID=UPI00070FD9BC|nr:M14 family metallopeptidase [Bordetella sp. N]ALM82272.1 deacylase [Bordetella sp. N]